MHLALDLAITIALLGIIISSIILVRKLNVANFIKFKFKNIKNFIFKNKIFKFKFPHE